MMCSSIYAVLWRFVKKKKKKCMVQIYPCPFALTLIKDVITALLPYLALM